MAQLLSPGVSVTITDESFYSSSGPGTVPLIFIVTAQDKLDSSGTGIAQGTTKANAGKLYLITSQRELIQTFGTPNFYSIGGSQQHGYELNEYGLLAAHSYLGVSNRAFVMRSDLNTSELEPLDEAPLGTPSEGSFWLDLNLTKFGVSKWNAVNSTWDNVPLTFINEGEYDSSGVPLATLPYPIGTYAIVAGRTTNLTPTENQVFRRASTGWLLLDNAVVTEDVQFASHINYPVLRSDNLTPLVAGDIWVRTTTPNNGANYVLKMYNGDANAFVNVTAPLYNTNNAATVAYGANLSAASVFVRYDNSVAANNTVETQILRHNGAKTLSITGTAVAPVFTIADEMAINGVTVTLSGTSLDSLVADIIAANIPGITAKKDALNRLVIINSSNLDIVMTNVLGTPVTTAGFMAAATYTNWVPLTYTASVEEPFVGPDTGRLWYSTDFKVDILRNDGTGSWVPVDDANLFIQPSTPLAPLNNDLWVDTDDIDNYPVIRRYNSATMKWVNVDNTDQTTPNGIIFQDARPDPEFGTGTGINNGAGINVDLDADRPDPLLYPMGMLLWNTRYSTMNVKQWTPAYTFEGNLVGNRWVTVSGNKLDGSPYMGREAVRRVIVTSLQASIQGNEDIRSEILFYNLIAAPGYTELIDEMISLNIDRKETAFVIGDAPFKLPATGTALQEWASNANNAATNGPDGLVTRDKNLAVYYPNGFTTNLDGNEVVVPASHIALRTYAYNDQVAYQWFAPAGYTRGLVSNATSVGYLNDEDEFIPVFLNEGLRDVLYTNNVNPISVEPNRGLVIMGQKTRHNVESALDRVNVARLINFIRYQMDRITRPFLFEPNDGITRKAVKNVVDRFLSELVGLRALDDFLTVVDESNNTPARIDRNELYVDVFLVPIKAVEFIYIPIRIRNTGSL